jgi:hypothetical protein
MKSDHRLIFGCLALSLAACAHTGGSTWQKDGATQEDFDKAVAHCDFESKKAVNSYDRSYQTIVGSVLDMRERRIEVAHACMRAQGWRLIGK